MSRLLLSIVEGRLVRDLFENGLLDMLERSGVEVSILSPATRNEAYVSRWKRTSVQFLEWRPPQRTKWQMRSWYLRKYAGTKFGAIGQRAFYRAEGMTTLKARRRELDVFDQVQPDFYLATHTHKFDEEPLVSAARATGVKTLGLVRSWDNVQYGLRTRPDDISVWNQVNRDEVISLEKYRPSNVHITGPAQFDPYFDTSGHITREQLCETLGLDASRPILTYATIGQYFPDYDETYLVDLLLKLIEAGDAPRDTQLVVRLHPLSRYEQFHRFRSDSRVRLSFVHTYIPGLTWMMDRRDVFWLGNLLRHSEVVVTPGSTITLETAIFDTPTLVPIFHTTMPELGRQYFSFIMGKHFQRIKELGLVPITDRVDEFVSNLRDAFKNRHWFQPERQRLREMYIPFNDGRCTERLFRLILSKIHNEDTVKSQSDLALALSPSLQPESGDGTRTTG